MEIFNLNLENQLFFGLGIGLMGSLHCVGMCGPIVLTTSTGHFSSSLRLLFGQGFYSLGRVLSYSLLGVIYGAFGVGINALISQKTLSITVGGLMLVSVFLPKRLKRFKRFLEYTPLLGTFIRRLKNTLGGTLSRWVKQPSTFHLFLIGILNGFLPCGLVYVALSHAIATADPVDGALVMAGFGIGTVPTMLGISVFSFKVGKSFKTLVLKLSPLLIFILGLLLIMRGIKADGLH